MALAMIGSTVNRNFGTNMCTVQSAAPLLLLLPRQSASPKIWLQDLPFPAEPSASRPGGSTKSFQDYERVGQNQLWEPGTRADDRVPQFLGT